MKVLLIFRSNSPTVTKTTDIPFPYGKIRHDGCNCFCYDSFGNFT
ncbi:hypothetical protein P4T53_26785 [Bacillus paramycoides]|nr:hypothetical protein [Bacillus paramycoides]